MQVPVGGSLASNIAGWRRDSNQRQIQDNILLLKLEEQETPVRISREKQREWYEPYPRGWQQQCKRKQNRLVRKIVKHSEGYRDEETKSGEE